MNRTKLGARLPVWGAAALGAVTLACGSGNRGVLADSVSREVSKAVAASGVSAGLVTTYPPAAQDTIRQWTFDDLPAGKAPSGFTASRTGGGRPPVWTVLRVEDAPSAPHVLVQADTDRASNRFSLIVADAPRLVNGVFSVRCKPVSGRVDRACGIVFRFEENGDYYLVRANALEDNVRLYTVKSGKRREIASWSGAVSSGAWHDLRVTADGDQMRVLWDDKQVLEKRDRTFADSGRVGLWTKADSYTLFDNLVVARLRSHE